jgi:hypothetical protein
MRPTAWHAYITDVMKSPVRVGRYKETPLEAKLETARLWAQVLRWELEAAKPRLVIAVGNNTRQFMDVLKREKLIPSGYEFRSMTHSPTLGSGPRDTSDRCIRAESSAITRRWRRSRLPFAP